MAFVTVSTWKLDETVDRATIIAETEKNMALMKEAGVERACFFQTGPGEGVAVAIYPDKATRDRARDTVLKIRADAESDRLAKVTGEMEGETLAGV